MRFNLSYFSISLPLVKENLRRFWTIPALGFLAYFLSGIFPILMSYSHIDDMYDHVAMCLSNQHVVFMAVHLILPIITAVIVFRYVQNGSSVTTMHAMPFTRSQLFNSGVLSGFILIITPILANEIIFQLIAKPTYQYYMYTDYEQSTALSEAAADIFTRSDVVSWFWQSLLIVVVTYAVAVFAGMVTSNTVMHLGLAFGFNFLAPALYLAFNEYCTEFLFGFSSGSHERIFLALSPFMGIFSNNENLSLLPLQIWYICFTVVMLALSHRLYERRCLEKVGDSAIFNFMIPFICYLIAFFGMSLTGYYFETLKYNFDHSGGSNHMYFYCGLGAGAIIAFILGRMAVLSSLRIFNRASLKSFFIYAVLSIVFVSSITLDLTGFETRVPSPDKVTKVYFSGFDFLPHNTINDTTLFKSSESKTEDNMLCYLDSQNIEAFTLFHQEIVDNRKTLEQGNVENHNVINYNSSQIHLGYNTSPVKMNRDYLLNQNLFAKNKHLKQIYESSEYKKYFSFSNLNYDEITGISLHSIYYNDDETLSKRLITDSSKINSMLAAMEKDFQDRTYEEYVNPVHPYNDIFLSYSYRDTTGMHMDNELQISVLSSDENTIKWLKDNSYSPYLECDAHMIEKIVFTERDSSKDMIQQVADTNKTTDESLDSVTSGVDSRGRRILVITDPVQIQEILDTCSIYSRIYADAYYDGQIVFKDLSSSTTINMQTIVYNYESLPKFMADYFN